jgi:hypothetical protein
LQGPWDRWLDGDCPGTLGRRWASQKPNPSAETGILKIPYYPESAFDPNHPYYDEKSSRDKPKWEVVHVEFRRKFDDVLTLETLKSYAKPGAALENMQTLRQSRVSVSSVTPKEWRFIMSLLGESEPETVAGGKVAEESPEVKGDEAKELSGNETIDRAPVGSAEDRANGQTTAESRPDLTDGADKSEKELN